MRMMRVVLPCRIFSLSGNPSAGRRVLRPTAHSEAVSLQSLRELFLVNILRGNAKACLITSVLCSKEIQSN